MQVKIGMISKGGGRKKESSDNRKMNVDLDKDSQVPHIPLPQHIYSLYFCPRSFFSSMYKYSQLPLLPLP